MKKKKNSFLTMAFCVVIILLCLFIQYLATQQTKVSMIQMAEWQSSVEDAYGTPTSEDGNEEESINVDEDAN